MREPPRAYLMRQFSIEPFGGNVAKLADIDGDGELELLIMQTAGQFQSKVFGQRDDMDEVDRTVHCLTAVTLEGQVLWQVGRPYDREAPYTGHGGPDMFQVDDIDADGAAEVVLLRQDSLVVLDAATGQEQSAVRLPADNYTRLFTAQLGAPGEGRHIICKNNDRAYPPWDYANPIIVYNPDLSIYRAPFSVPGAGHNMIASDINGDGRDELFIGYSLLDHECNVIWSLDLGPGFDYVHDHADQIALADMDGDGELEVRYAGSEDFFVADLKGNLLWKATAGHSQNSIAGSWGPDGEMRLIMCEKHRGIWGMDVTGRILWNRTDINGYVKDNVRWSRNGTPSSWALFRPQLKPFAETPYESDRAWSRTLWPRLMAGDGRLYDVFPWRAEYAHPRQLIRAKRSYDNGLKYEAIVCDIDGDEMDEVVVWDRRFVWVFHDSE